jgi:hypothetical protein
MQVLFNSEKLEHLSSKFIIQLAKFFSEKEIVRISIFNVEVTPFDSLNEITIINFQEVDTTTKYNLSITHAKDMSCSNWSLKKVGIDIAELLQKLANAQITYAQCGGHGKAESNRQQVIKLKEQLKELGVEIPTDDELYKIGVFNGQGSC